MAGYAAIHLHLTKHYPKTGICVECGSVAKTQYSLIHGRTYSRNPDDYRELCPACHVIYDHGGERSARAKLTAGQVREIRQRYNRGTPGDHRSRQPGSMASLAAEFGVARSTIGQIIRGERWSSV